MSPATSAVFGLAMSPVWLAAGRRLRETFAARRVPLLALGAAYSFTLMMFNLPVPGGTTVHATGAVLLAIVLGPWAALLAVTVTLVVQALFFADGGVLALGVNCFGMAFVMPFTGWAVYRLAGLGAGADSRRRSFAAGLGAWVGLNAAALVTALALGVQPILHRSADGRALYFPFGPHVTLPALLIPHALIGGVAEAFFTVFALRAVRAAAIPLAGEAAAGPTEERSGSRGTAWALAGLGLLVLASPLGLLAAGAGWGEWSPAELARRAGQLPHALGAVERGVGPRPPFPGYLASQGAFAFALAGVAGEIAIGAIALLGGRALLARFRRRQPAAAATGPAAPGALPAWMRAPAVPEAELARPRRARGDFAMRTLADLAGGMHELLLRERLARGPGLLQALDPRAKILGLLGLVVLACLQRSPAPALALLALASALGLLSRVPPRLLLGRVALAVGLFVGLVTLPAALDLVTPGPALVVLRREPLLAVTRPGAALVLFYVLRAAAATSFAALLALTTPWSGLLAGLRGLRAPRLFVDVLGMSWRYFALLLESAREMFVARRSRTAGRPAARLERRFLGGAAAALGGRTLALAEEVHFAMLARGGGGGGPAAARDPRLGARDHAWLAALALLAIAVVLWNRLA